jgi:hypothetical protein
MRIYREKGDAAGPLTVRKGCRRAPCHCRSERVRSTVRERRCRGAAPRRPRWADARRRRCCGPTVGACEGKGAGDVGLRRPGRDGQRRAHATEEPAGGGATASWGWPRRGEGADGAAAAWRPRHVYRRQRTTSVFFFFFLQACIEFRSSGLERNW